MEFFLAVDEKQNLVAATNTLYHSTDVARRFSDEAIVMKILVEIGANEKVGPYTEVKHLATFYPPFELG